MASDNSFDHFEQQRSQLHSALKKYEVIVLPSQEIRQVRPIVHLDFIDGNISKANKQKHVTYKRTRLDNDSIVLSNA